MLVSQLIYTGCGKDKTGAFSVWSKSLDITKVEENEIRDKMLYKRPSNLPFEPTTEQIETLFPKKFGYFYLTSGRVCLAQSVYIGNVYSDLDKRTGNYIIHAFVFDETEDVIPMNFIDSDLFKRGLTYEEWHDQEAPEDLPKIAIEDKPSSLTKQDIDTFFNADKIQYFKQLLQAVINALNSEQKVTFYDAHANLKYWYKAISLCLPKKMQYSLTFNTFFTPSMPLPSQTQQNVAVINTEVKIRNITPTVSSTIYSYQQDARAGKYAFDFENNIYPASIPVSKYVDAVVKLLQSNVFNAIMFVDAVGKIQEKCNVDLEFALDIYCLLNKKIAEVDNSEKLNHLLGYAQKYYQDALPEVADCLYQYGIESNTWQLSSSIAEIYRFIFDYSDVADKALMIHKYVSNQQAFGVDKTVSCESYSDMFKKQAPFSWVNFLDYLFDCDNMNQYFKANGTSFNSYYLIFNTFVDAMSDIANQQDQKQIALNYFLNVAKAYVQKEMLREVLALVKCIGKCGAKWQGWIIKKTYAALAGEQNKISTVCKPEFSLSLAESCDDYDVSVELVSSLIIENEKNNDFIKLYVENYDRNPTFYAGISKLLNSDIKFNPFLENVEFYRFAISSTVTKMQLRDYYDKYVVVGKDRGLFTKKIKQYLSNYREKDCINESLDCFNTWIISANIEVPMRKEIAKIIADCFFSVSVDTLRDYISQRGTTRIKEIMSEFQEGEYHIPAHYYVISFGENVKKLIIEIKSKKNSPYVQSTKDKLFDDTFYRIPKDEYSKEMFIKDYLDDVVELYLLLAGENDFEDMFGQLFKPIYACASFERCLLDTMSNLNGKQYDLLISYMIVCACNRANKFTDYLMNFVKKLLEDIGRGKRKKMFAQLLENVPSQYEKKTRAFVEQYQKEHESFFDRLFGSFGKNDDKREVPKSKDKRKWKK